MAAWVSGCYAENKNNMVSANVMDRVGTVNHNHVKGSGCFSGEMDAIHHTQDKNLQLIFRAAQAPERTSSTDERICSSRDSPLCIPPSNSIACFCR